MKKTLLLWIALLLLTVPFLVSAQVNVKNVDDLYKVLDKIAGIIARVFWFISAIFVFYAAFLYLTAGGNSDKVSKAHRQLWYTVIAVTVALFAWGLPKFIENTLNP